MFLYVSCSNNNDIASRAYATPCSLHHTHLIFEFFCNLLKSIWVALFRKNPVSNAMNRIHTHKQTNIHEQHNDQSWMNFKWAQIWFGSIELLQSPMLVETSVAVTTQSSAPHTYKYRLWMIFISFHLDGKVCTWPSMNSGQNTIPSTKRSEEKLAYNWKRSIQMLFWRNFQYGILRELVLKSAFGKSNWKCLVGKISIEYVGYITETKQLWSENRERTVAMCDWEAHSLPTKCMCYISLLL